MIQRACSHPGLNLRAEMVRSLILGYPRFGDTWVAQRQSRECLRIGCFYNVLCPCAFLGDAFGFFWALEPPGNVITPPLGPKERQMASQKTWHSVIQSQQGGSNATLIFLFFPCSGTPTHSVLIDAAASKGGDGSFWKRVAAHGGNPGQHTHRQCITFLPPPLLDNTYRF